MISVILFPAYHNLSVSSQSHINHFVVSNTILPRIRGGSRICERGGRTMASARAYNGGLGAEPSAGSRGRAPGGGQGGFAPLKLKAFMLLNVPRSRKFTQFFVFVCKVFIQKFERIHPERGVKWEWVGKIRNFQPVCRRISETVHGRTNVTIND